MQRISIVGSPGSGKTTFSKALATRLNLTRIELDAHFHLPNWTPRDREDFRADIGARVRAPRWVVDGNYSAVRELVWAQADTVVWLDMPRRTVFPALLSRTLYRGALGVELWNGNKERLSFLLKTTPEENLLLWTAMKFHQYRRRYLKAMADPQWAHLRFVRLCSRSEIAVFLDEINTNEP